MDLSCLGEVILGLLGKGRLERIFLLSEEYYVGKTSLIITLLLASLKPLLWDTF